MVALQIDLGQNALAGTDANAKKQGGLTDAEKQAGSTSLDSRSYIVSTSDPVEVASQIGAFSVKLIGGNIVGSLRYESTDRERGFLTKVGNSFCFPLMERRLMNTSMDNMLQCAEDLALKSFVAARCIAPQLRLESGCASRLAELEERVARLERERSDL